MSIIDSAYVESSCGEEQAKSVARALLRERDAALLQIEEIRKEFALHSCPDSKGFCWLCNASARVEMLLNRKLIEKRKDHPQNCKVCKSEIPEEAWSGICGDCQDRGHRP